MAENGGYLIEGESGSFSVSIITSTDKITFGVKSTTESSTLNVNSSYTLPALIGIDKKFRAFDSVQELPEEFNWTFTEKRASIKQQDNISKLVVTLIGIRDIEIPLIEGDAPEPSQQPSGDHPTVKDTIAHIEQELAQLHDRVKKDKNDYIDGQKDAELVDLQETVNNGIKLLQEKLSAIEEIVEDKLTETNEPLINIDLDTLNQKANIEFKTPITSLTLLKDGRVAACADQREIDIYNLATNQKELSLEGHTNWVTFVSLMENGDILSSSIDQTMKIWNIKQDSYECVGTITGHTQFVMKAIQIEGNKICSCSNDDTIRIWEGEAPYRCIKELNKHTRHVIGFIILKNKKYLVSIGGDEKLIFWKNGTWEFVKAIDGIVCYNNNGLTELDEGRLLIAGGKPGLVTEVSTLKLKVEHVYKDDVLKGIWSLFSLGNGFFLAGVGETYKNGSLCVYNANSSKIIKLKSDAHEDVINGFLLIDEHTILSCGKDHNVRIWEF